MLVINGIELELNIFEATQAESFERANERVLEEKDKVNDVAGLSEKIKLYCDIVYDFFDDVFGDGTADSIFKGRQDMLECLEAYTDVVEYANSNNGKADELIARIKNQSTPQPELNRQQRRAQR